MEPRTLEQIIQEYNTINQPRIDYLRQRQAEAPKMVEADIAAADAAQTKAYDDILRGAQRRGLVYSGIPLGEQANYASTVYAPAILAARTKGTEYAQGLEGTILDLQAQSQTGARDWYKWLTEFNESRRQFNESLKKSGSGSGYPTIRPSTNEGDQGVTNPYLPKINKSDKGYAFTDAYGSPVTAAQYVQLYQAQGGGLTYRQLLQQMANTGDQNAKIALDYVGDDYKFGSAPEWARPALEAVGASGTYAKPQSSQSKAWYSRREIGNSTNIPNYGWRSKK